MLFYLILLLTPLSYSSCLVYCPPCLVAYYFNSILYIYIRIATTSSLPSPIPNLTFSSPVIHPSLANLILPNDTAISKLNNVKPSSRIGSPLPSAKLSSNNGSIDPTILHLGSPSRINDFDLWQTQNHLARQSTTKDPRRTGDGESDQGPRGNTCGEGSEWFRLPVS